MRGAVLCLMMMTGIALQACGEGLAPEASPSLPPSPEPTLDPTPPGPRVTLLDFSEETPGAEPRSVAPVVGFWRVDTDEGDGVLVVDGTDWKLGQPAASLAESARVLYGERYAEFLDSVKAFAHFPYAVVRGIELFEDGEIQMRFKGVAGRIDQAAGILFDLQPNGDYLALRANPLEDNLVLWQFVRGKRSSVKWIRGTPTPSGEWHTLTLRVSGPQVEGLLNGELLLEHTLARPVSGRVGFWSKADSLVYFDDYRVTPAERASAPSEVLGAPPP